MNGKTKHSWSQFGISFLARALSIAALCLIPLLFANSPARAAGCLVTNTNDSGPGSLRQCLLDTQSGDSITFDPAVFPRGGPATIALTSEPLPSISQGNLIIDASQAGVVLDGSTLSDGPGLRIKSNGNVIKGLQILHFPEDGIRLENGASYNLIGGVNATPGGACSGDCNLISSNGNIGVSINGSDTTGNIVSGNYIGVHASGTSALGNTSNGVFIGDGAHDNIIGGSSPGARNLISGSSTNQGIHIMNGHHNTISGNFIGVDASGTLALGNHYDGILISHGSQYNIIGGDTPGERNLISGNGLNGVAIQSDGTNFNVVSGNYIGTDVSGTNALPNTVFGVQVDQGSSNNLIGGTNASPGGACSGQCNLISGNNSDGVWIADSGTNNNTVSGNYIGTDINGATAIPNNGFGVHIRNGAQNNLIGGDTVGERNVISGNAMEGVAIKGGGTTYNVVSGNYIGTNANGVAAIPNKLGLSIFESAQYNTIGGTTPGQRNVISGNTHPEYGAGVMIGDPGTDYNTIIGNYIGTDASGTAALSNGGPDGGAGATIQGGASQNAIGGDTPEERNLISGNNGVGVGIGGASFNTVSGNYIGTDVSGTNALPNTDFGVQVDKGSSNNLIGGTNASPGGSCSGQCNLISGNDDSGVTLENSGTANNVVSGNYIGTDVNGTAAIPNGSDGVDIFDQASNNTIGGATPGERNLLSGNISSGVSIDNAGTVNNTVSGNYIGTDVSGTTVIANNDPGVFIGGGAQFNLIGGRNASPGGACTGQCNLISGNLFFGVGILGVGTDSNVVSGNYLGTDVSGTIALGNMWNGVHIGDGPEGNTVGGTTPGERNVISGNGDEGVLIGGADNNLIIGNYIGTNASGTAALGNAGNGIAISELGKGAATRGITIQGNLISGNAKNGINMFGAAIESNIVTGNYIGTDATGSADMGNAWVGVWIGGEARNNTIGGATSAAGNLIAFNKAGGVAVQSGTGNTIRSNSIFANANLGIDLGSDGITPNDPGDGDTGPNNMQNFPVLTSAETNSSSTIIEVSFNSAPNTTFTFEFFANAACDPTNYGEGADFLVSATQATDASGQASFAVSVPMAVPVGQFITATATDPNGNTSEFSQCVLVQAQVGDGQVGPGGGTVVDTAGTGAAFSVGPGVLPGETSIVIEVVPDPGVSPPPGFIGPATGFVNVTLEPNPSPLPAPGATLTLPLVVPLPPGTLLDLFRYDPATNTLIDANIAGTVDPGGTSATFSGVTEFSIFVGAQSASVILDDFNRPDGRLGNNWGGAKLQVNYRIVNQAVQVLAGGPIYWKPDTFGFDQEAHVTLTKVHSDGHHSVLLKVQLRREQPDWRRGVIAIFYNTQTQDKVGIETYIPGHGLKTIFSVPMTLNDGDVLGGRALANGNIQVLVNGVLIGSANAEFFAGKGGSIGVWFFGPKHARFDDFGGKDLP